MRSSNVRCAFVLGLGLACAGCIGNGAVGSTQSAVELCPTGPVVQGIDVSHYDGTIDWAKVHAAGIDFAFMKATESNDFIDPNFATNWAGASAAGVIRGAYHFFRPEVDPVAQADYFIATAGLPAAGDLPLSLDLEVVDTDTAAQAAYAASQFLQRIVDRTGRMPIVYTSESFYNSTLGAPAGLNDTSLWVANWQVSCPNMPTAWTTWQFWQHADDGTVSGISGTADVDLDEFNGTLDDLRNYAGATQPDGGTSVGDDGGMPGSGAPGEGDMSTGATGGDDGGSIKTPARRGGCDMGGASSSSAWSGALFFLLLAVAFSRAAARRAGCGRSRRA